MTGAMTGATRRNLLGSIVAGSAVASLAQDVFAQSQGLGGAGRPVAQVDLSAYMPSGGPGNDDASGWFNAAIAQIAQRGGGVLLVPTANYVVQRPIYLVSGVTVDLCGSTLRGTGTIFESGTVSNGITASNLGSPHESRRVVGARVLNGRIVGADRGFNLYNFNENSEIAHIQFAECGVAVYSERPFYSRYTDLTSRGVSGGSRSAAFHFKDFTNICAITNVRAIGRALGFEFDGGVNGQEIIGCSAEKCQDGMKFKGEVNPVSIRSCYFEDIPGTAMDFTTPMAHRAVEIDANWFQNVGVGVTGVQMLGGTIGNSNYFLKTLTPVAIEDPVSTICVDIKSDRFKGNAQPGAPAGFQLGAAVDVRYMQQLFDPNTGRTVVKQSTPGSGPIPLSYAGNSGHVPGDVPFCIHSSTGSGQFAVNVDTRITFDDYAMVLFSLKVTDADGPHVMHGRVFGAAVYADNSSGKAIRASNVNGLLRLSLERFSGNGYRIEGVVRHA